MAEHLIYFIHCNFIQMHSTQQNDTHRLWGQMSSDTILLSKLASSLIVTGKGHCGNVMNKSIVVVYYLHKTDKIQSLRVHKSRLLKV